MTSVNSPGKFLAEEGPCRPGSPPVPFGAVNHGRTGSAGRGHRESPGAVTSRSGEGLVRTEPRRASPEVLAHYPHLFPSPTHLHCPPPSSELRQAFPSASPFPVFCLPLSLASTSLQGFLSVKEEERAGTRPGGRGGTDGRQGAWAWHFLPVSFAWDPLELCLHNDGGSRRVPSLH